MLDFIDNHAFLPFCIPSHINIYFSLHLSIFGGDGWQT